MGSAAGGCAPDPPGPTTNTLLRKASVLIGMAVCFVLIADGIAMLLPGPTSPIGGAAILALGLVGLLYVLPRSLSPSGRDFSAILSTRFGLFVLPVLCLPIAGLWLASNPLALTGWFAVAWLGVWLACLVLSSTLPCPACGRPFGRRGASLRLTSSTCAHCNADARGEARP